MRLPFEDYSIIHTGHHPQKFFIYQLNYYENYCYFSYILKICHLYVCVRGNYLYIVYVRIPVFFYVFRDIIVVH